MDKQLIEENLAYIAYLDSCLGVHPPVSAQEAIATMLPERGVTLIRGGSGMHFCNIQKIPDLCTEKAKYFVVPGRFGKSQGKYLTRKKARLEKCRPSPFLGAKVRVIDLDMPAPFVCSLEQAEFVADLLPKVAIIYSNGLQLQFLPSNSWYEDSRFLWSIGRQLERLLKDKFSPSLFYDSHHWNERVGKPYASERHAYRLPLGWADRANRPPLAFGSASKTLWSVHDAWRFLGKPPLPAPPTIVSSKSHKSVNSVKRSASLAENYAEWSTILRRFWGCIKQDFPKSRAIFEILRESWNHHTAAQIKKGLEAIEIKKSSTSSSRSLSSSDDAKPLPTSPFLGTPGTLRPLQRKFDLKSHFLHSSFDLIQDFPPAIALEKMKTLQRYKPVLREIEHWIGEEWESEALRWLVWQTQNAPKPKFWCSWDWLDQVHEVLVRYEEKSVKCDEVLRQQVIALHPPIQHDFQEQGSSFRHLQRGLKLLVESGIIKRVGKARATKYEIPADYRSRVEACKTKLCQLNSKNEADTFNSKFKILNNVTIDV